MNSLQTLLAMLIAVGAPGTFLLLIYYLDLYASRTFRLVLLCFAWGSGGGIGLAYIFNVYIISPLMLNLHLDRILLYVAFAPLVEETVKLLPLLYVSRHPKFTYFVDGAIYGFASGIGFSIAENFLYMSQHPGVAVQLAIIRAFSTCLMHGASTALVGAAIGRFRLKRYTRRWLAVIGGSVIAVMTHALFNIIVLIFPLSGSTVVLTAVIFGMTMFGVTVLFVLLGLYKERRWLIESLDQHIVDLLNVDLTPEEQGWLADVLDRQAGVSVAEVRASQAYEYIDEILQPIWEQFPDRAEQLERIVLQQAQIGIKRRLQEEAEDVKTRKQLEQEVARLEEDTKRLRRRAGGRAMSYLKCVFDEHNPQINTCLEELVSCADPLACRDEEAVASKVDGAQESDSAARAAPTSG